MKYCRKKNFVVNSKSRLLSIVMVPIYIIY
jgi:hypothetical protein